MLQHTMKDDLKLKQAKYVIAVIVLLIIAAVAANLYFTSLFVNSALEVSRLEELTQTANTALRFMDQLRSPVSSVIETGQVEDERKRFDGYFSNLQNELIKADSLLLRYPEQKSHLEKSQSGLAEIRKSANIIYGLVAEEDREGAREELADGFEPAVSDIGQEPLRVMSALLNDMKAEALREVEKQKNNPKLFNLISSGLVIVILILGGRSIITSYRRVQAAQRETARALQGTQDILDTVRQGLITVDSEGRIRPQMSSFTRELFGGREIAGETFYKLFYPEGDPARIIEFDWGEGTVRKEVATLIHEWESWLTDFAFKSSILNDLPFSEDILPQAEITLGEGERIIFVSGERIFEEGAIAGVMINLTDITAQKRAEAEKRSSIGLIGAAARDKDGFMRLLGGLSVADEMLAPWTDEEGAVALKFAEDPEVLETGVKIKAEEANAVYRAFHTQKADAKIFMADDIAKAIHKLEETLNTVKGKEIIDMDTFAVLGERRAELGKAVAGALDLLRPVLGEDLGTVKGSASGERRIVEVRVSVEEVEELAKELSLAGVPAETVERVRSLADVEAVTMLRRFEKMVADLGERLGKNIEYVTENVETRVPKKLLDLAMDALVHVVRNAVDHGIEGLEERLAAGKPEKAMIKLVVEKSSGAGRSVAFHVSDDGRGIDPQVIGRLAVAKKLVSEKELAAMEKKDILRFIFKPGFSTKREATDISGRGVGLDVALNNIEKQLGGHVRLDSSVNRGSKFSLVIPLV